MRTTWSQPFRWGLLMASDPVGPFEAPDLDRSGGIRATDTCLAVPVLHAADVVTPPDWPDDEPLPEATVSVTVIVDDDGEDDVYEYEGVLHCDSGQLAVGDPDNERLIAVPAGRVIISVQRDPIEFSERVGIRIRAMTD